MKPSVAIVGPGRLGRVLGLALAKAGYPIRQIVSRDNPESMRKARKLAKSLGASAAAISQATLEADVTWLCVPDRQIAPVARKLAGGLVGGKIALHSSGALRSDELDALRKRGLGVASAHPMMTFVRGAVPSLDGVAWALEGDRRAAVMARQIVRDLGGSAFMLEKELKPAYHAWGAFLSPLMVALLVTSEHVARAASLSQREAGKRMMPIIHQTLSNYAALRPKGAFSGPLIRGDAEVVRLHLKAIRKVPEAENVYKALARAAMRYLPVENRKELRKIISG